MPDVALSLTEYEHRSVSAGTLSASGLTFPDLQRHLAGLVELTPSWSGGGGTCAPDGSLGRGPPAASG